MSIPEEATSELPLPLLELFTRLRQAGLPLGMTEYQLVLKALQSGFGLPNEAAIARLCRTLWVKSEEDQILFDYHFAAVMAAEREQLAAETEREAIAQDSQNIQKTTSRKRRRKYPRWWLIRRLRWRAHFKKVAAALGVLAVAAIGVSLWSLRPKCPYFTSRPGLPLGLGDIVQNDGAYEYNITTCQGDPSSIPQIEVLLKHPQLQFTDNQDGTAQLRGQLPTTSTLYTRFAYWNYQGKLLFETSFSGPAEAMYISPNEQYFIIKNQNRAQIRDVRGDLISDLDNLDNRTVEFSSDGEHFLALRNSGEATLFDWLGTPVASFENPLSINSIHISPTEQKLITLSGDGSARLWDFQGNLLIDWHNQGITNIQFSPNGKYIATLSNKQTGRLYDISGELITDFRNQQRIKEIQFSPDNQHLIVRAQLGSLRLWTVRGTALNSIGGIGTADVLFSPDGQAILTRSNKDTARLWSLSGEQLSDFEQLEDIRYVEFNPDGRTLITNLSDDTARLWNIQGDRIHDFKNASNIFNFQFSPSGQHILTRSQTKAATLWDTYEGTVLFYPDSTADHKSVAFSSTAQMIATLSETNKVKLQLQGKTAGANSYQRTDTQSFRLINESDAVIFEEIAGGFMGAVLFGLISLFILLPLIYFAIRSLTASRSKPEAFPAIGGSAASTVSSESTLSQAIEDELQVAQAIQQKLNDSDSTLRAFTETSEYFPITRRQMQQSWRSLRQPVREGPPTELDVTATINQVGRRGILLHPILRPRRTNRHQLLLLIDQDGSMVPFHALSARLSQTAIYGGRLANTDVYYFHNAPLNHLYKDPYRQTAQPIESVLASVRSEYTGVLIFSDAGAARGALNPQRLVLTLRFLDQLRRHLRYVAWLNPMPRNRWVGTAREIAKHVPMFELSRQGLNQSIEVLRGKPFHLEG